MSVLSIKVPIRKKSLETYRMHLVCKSRLMLVFDFQLKIIRSYHNFIYNIALFHENNLLDSFKKLMSLIQII